MTRTEICRSCAPFGGSRACANGPETDFYRKNGVAAAGGGDTAYQGEEARPIIKLDRTRF